MKVEDRGNNFFKKHSKSECLIEKGKGKIEKGVFREHWKKQLLGIRGQGNKILEISANQISYLFLGFQSFQL